VATEPLNPGYTENTSGIIAAITACIEAAGGSVTSYPKNTAGIIQALIDLKTAITTGGTSAQSVAALAPAVAGEALDVGDVVYVQSSDGRVYKALSNNMREKANVLGLVKAAVSNAGDAVTVVVRGPIKNMSGLSAGVDYYLDNNGGITQTAPTGGQVYSVHIGQAISETELDVQPMQPIFTT
tara:strand:+ start:3332 stop:3880 length:549 start_codon:yes stop_codon:yes gene_type:complete